MESFCFIVNVCWSINPDLWPLKAKHSSKLNTRKTKWQQNVINGNLIVTWIFRLFHWCLKFKSEALRLFLFLHLESWARFNGLDVIQNKTSLYRFSGHIREKNKTQGQRDCSQRSFKDSRNAFLKWGLPWWPPSFWNDSHLDQAALYLQVEDQTEARGQVTGSCMRSCVLCTQHRSSSPLSQSPRIKYRESSNTSTSSPALRHHGERSSRHHHVVGFEGKDGTGLTTQAKAKYSKAAPRTLVWAKGFSLQQDNSRSSQGHSQVCSKETESFHLQRKTWKCLTAPEMYDKWKGLKTFWQLF